MHATHHNRLGGGVALHVAGRCKSSILQNVSFSDTCLESIGVELMCCTKTTIVINVYRPPNGSFPDFLRKLTAVSEFIRTKNHNEDYILGDWNINLLKQEDQYVTDFIALMYSYSLLSTTTKPTRVTN